MSDAIFNTASTLVYRGVAAFLPKRSFEQFSDFVSISETHQATAQTTDYPIENGTQGTDHIIKQPDSLIWDVGFAESENPVQIYAKLHALMVSGTPFDAITGLKTYSNLVLLGISATTDVHTNRVLRASLQMREIIITSTQTTTIADTSKQGSPQSTASTQESGKKQAIETEPKRKEQLESRLHKIAQGL